MSSSGYVKVATIVMLKRPAKTRQGHTASRRGGLCRTFKVGGNTERTGFEE